MILRIEERMGVEAEAVEVEMATLPKEDKTIEVTGIATNHVIDKTIEDPGMATLPKEDKIIEVTGMATNHVTDKTIEDPGIAVIDCLYQQKTLRDWTAERRDLLNHVHLTRLSSVLLSNHYLLQLCLLHASIPLSASCFFFFTLPLLLLSNW